MAERECCHGTKGCEGQGDKHWCESFHVGKADPRCALHHYLEPDGHCTCSLSVADEVRKFLRALGSEENIDAIGSVGKFRCRKKLSNGAVVTFSFAEPKR